MFLSFFALVSRTSEFTSVPRSSINCVNGVLIAESAVFNHFLVVEWRRARQLSISISLKKTKADKSSNRSISWFSISPNNRSPAVRSLADRLCIVLVKYIAATLIATLLLRGGVEQNPGPINKEFRLLSQNCRGLTDRKKLIRLLRQVYPNSRGSRGSSSLTIACLQETHKVDRFAIANCFKGQAVIDDGERNQRGACILVPESFEVCSSHTSGFGRWAIAVVKPKSSIPGSDHKHVIATIYAPNCHREAIVFYQEFFNSLDDVTDTLVVNGDSFDTIVTGDFNVVLDPNAGASNRLVTRPERELAVLIIDGMESRNLLEPDSFLVKDCYTWRRGTCLSKLDYLFVSSELRNRIKSATIKWFEFGTKLDHAAVCAQFSDGSPTTRGRSFPKVYSTDIRSEADKQWLLDQLLKCEEQIMPHWNPHMKLDFIKMMLRAKALELRQMRKFTDNSANIKSEIESIMANAPITIENSIKLDALKLKLSEIEEVEEQILSMKAGVKWREEGEKSTAYFLGRFKARSEGAIMHSLNLGTRIIRGTEGIIEVVKEFYTRLYNKPTPTKLGDANFCEEFFANCPKLDAAAKLQVARPLEIPELREALKTCTDSAPGLDGIPYSFYEVYQSLLLKYVLDSWNFALQTGSMAESHKRSCITLLPKKGKDLSLIGNWRPISLSSCDLKIITKAYANRLKLALPNILSEAQVAYTPGRDISFNNRILQYAKGFAAVRNLDFCVVSLDAQKAFDSVSHAYLEKVLEVYDFPNEFIHVFRTLYSDLTSVVQVNGSLSQDFRISNGVKQGDALSCGLFVLAMDPLLRNIHSNRGIEGMLVPINHAEEIEIKTLSYADDVTIICKNSSLQPLFLDYENFSMISGLTLNADKTEVFNLTDSPLVLSRVRYMDKVFEIGRVNKMRICGVWLARETQLEYKLNVLNKIDDMEAIVRSWGRRSLTLNGRMILAKTFLLSQIVYQAQVISFGKKEIKKIEKLIYSFVNGASTLYGPERIARVHLKAPKDSGGLNGIDVDSFIKAMAIKQFGKAMEKNRTLEALQRSIECPLDGISTVARSMYRANYRKFSANFAIPDLHQIELISGIPASLYLNATSHAARLVSQANIETLGDLQRLFTSGRVRSTCSKILRALPSHTANLIRMNCLVQSPKKILWLGDTDLVQINATSSKAIRLSVLNCKFQSLEVKLEKVYKRLDWPPPGIDQHQLFRNIWKIKNPILRAIRLKLIYKDVFSNERRFRFNMTDSPECQLCGQIESVEHQLFTCANASRIWDLYGRLTGEQVSSLFEVIACSHVKENEIIKSVLIKALVQIDRSRDKVDRQINADCIHYLGIEARSQPKQENIYIAAINKIRSS